jgi:NAD(P)-dependent dehydrogenase (short-subunit alcohol dehydrogenase family)
VAAALAEAGAAVTLMARTAAEVEEAAAAMGGEALVLDALDTETFATAMAARRGFHVFVNNAGTARHAHFLDVTPADYDAVMALNLRAAFFAAQAVARGMVRDGLAGSIINISSQMGHVGGPTRSVYCASKAGLEGLTKAMAIDLGPHGIRVNTLCPTFTRTPLTQPFFERPGFAEWALARILLGRVAEVTDMMGPAVFLASDAAAMVTGSALMVDGGWTAA